MRALVFIEEGGRITVEARDKAMNEAEKFSRVLLRTTDDAESVSQRRRSFGVEQSIECTMDFEVFDRFMTRLGLRYEWVNALEPALEASTGGTIFPAPVFPPIAPPRTFIDWLKRLVGLAPSDIRIVSAEGSGGQAYCCREYATYRRDSNDSETIVASGDEQAFAACGLIAGSRRWYSFKLAGGPCHRGDANG